MTPERFGRNSRECGRTAVKTGLPFIPPLDACLISLAVIMTVGGLLRFHALGVPQLVHDEALVASTALNDLGYILRRSLAADAHPPGFYSLTKLTMHFSTAEWFLRLPSTLAGLGTILLGFLLGRRLADASTGLFTAALLATHELHVMLSRAVRPHAIITLMAMAACWFYLDFLKRLDRASLARLCLVNGLMLLLHFNAVLLVGAQMALTCVLLLAGRIRPARPGFSFLVASGLLLPVNLFFLSARLGSFSGVDTNVPMAWTARRTLDNFDALLTLFPLPWANVCGWVLAAAGFLLLARTNRPGALVLAGFILVPPAALILARYGIIYEPWHVSFLIPFLLLFCGHAISRVVPSVLLMRVVLPAILALTAGMSLMSLRTEKIYTPDAPLFNHSFGQRQLAEALGPLLGENVGVSFEDREMREFTNWYLPRTGLSDLTRFQLSGTAPATLALVSPISASPSAPPSGQRLEVFDRQAEKTVRTALWKVSTWTIPRSPATRVPDLPVRLAFPSTMDHFLAQTATASDVVAVRSPLGDGIAPSRYDAPGTFSYRIESRAEAPVRQALLHFSLDNASAGNRFDVRLSLDGGPAITATSFSMAPFSGTVLVLLTQPGGFRTLDIACAMTCSSGRPDFHNIPEGPVFKGLEVALDAAASPFSSNVPVHESGLNPPESDQDGLLRWGIGPESHLLFNAPAAGNYRLDFSGASPMDGQAVEVLLDGRTLTTVDLPTAGRNVEASVPFTAETGMRLLVLRYAKYNHGPGGTFAPKDGRPMALAFRALSVTAAEPKPGLLVHARP